MIPGWLRGIPHPTYGWFGGAKKRWCKYDPLPKPVDEMDEGCMYHDIWLWLSNSLSHHERKVMRKCADSLLGSWLRNITKPYYHKIYGPVFNRFARVIFRP